jgi:hypothetical protein
MIKLGLFFVGGVATGLLIAKFYARSQVGDAIHDAFTKVGAGGGVLEETAKKIIVPLVA